MISTNKRTIQQRRSQVENVDFGELIKSSLIGHVLDIDTCNTDYGQETEETKLKDGNREIGQTHQFRLPCRSRCPYGCGVYLWQCTLYRGASSCGKHRIRWLGACKNSQDDPDEFRLALGSTACGTRP
jgi:hypothetical protein